MGMPADMDRRYPPRSHTSSTPPTSMSRSTASYDLASPTDASSEPRSEYLRRALLERKQRRTTRLSIPHIEAPLVRSATPDSLDIQVRQLEDEILDDAWTREAGMEERDTPRPAHLRRASTAGTGRHRGTPTQEMETNMTKLERTNFDLKIRVTMQEERAKKLEIELQEALEKIKDLAQANEVYDRQKEEQDERLKDLEDENAGLVSDNQEMFTLYDELVLDIEQKDNAISEAADMVCEVEDQKDTLEAELVLSNEKLLAIQDELEKWKFLAETASKPATDSDYYSAATERSDAKPPISVIADSRPSSARQSDYFSAESTTNNNPKVVSPSKEPRTGGIKGRLQGLKQSMKSYRTQRVWELRAKKSYTSLTNSSFLSQALATDYEVSKDDLIERMQQPVTEYAVDDATDISTLASWSGGRRGSAPRNPPLRHLYIEGEHVGGLAQLRGPLMRSPGAETPTTVRSANSAQRALAVQRSNSSCAIRSPISDRAIVPTAKDSKRLSRGRPELNRLNTTIPNSTSTAGTGILDRTTAWLGSLPRPGGDPPKDMIFNRNAEDFGALGVAVSGQQRKDPTSRVLWP